MLLLIECIADQAVDFPQFLMKLHGAFSGFCRATHSLVNQSGCCQNGCRVRLSVSLRSLRQSPHKVHAHGGRSLQIELIYLRQPLTHNALAIRYTKFQAATSLFHRTKSSEGRTYHRDRHRALIQALHLINRPHPHRE